MAQVNKYIYDRNTDQYNTLLIVDYDRQRIENATIAAHLLTEINAKNYPAFSKYLDQRNHAKRYRINRILEYLRSSDRNSLNPDTEPLFVICEDEETAEAMKAYTCIPYQRLTELYGGSNSTYAQIINFMLLAGMIEKHDISRYRNQGSWLAEEAYKHMKRNGYQRPAIYYHLPKWNQETLAAAEELASDRVRLRTLLNIIDAAGLEEAQQRYDTDRRSKKDVEEARAIIDRIAAQAILTNGYTTQREIITQLRQTRRKCLRKLKLKQLIKDYTKTLCDKYCWRYARPTAEQIEKWNLRKRNGEPNLSWIISPEGAERA